MLKNQFSPEFEEICLKYQRDVNCLIDSVIMFVFVNILKERNIRR